MYLGLKLLNGIVNAQCLQIQEYRLSGQVQYCKKYFRKQMSEAAFDLQGKDSSRSQKMRVQNHLAPQQHTKESLLIASQMDYLPENFSPKLISLVKQ